MRQQHFLVPLHFILQYIYILLSVTLGFLSIYCTLPGRLTANSNSLTASLYNLYDLTPELEIMIDGVHNREIRIRIITFVVENLKKNATYKLGYVTSLINQLKLSGFFSSVHSQAYIKGSQQIIKIRVQVNPIVKKVIVKDGSTSLITGSYISYIFKQQLGYPKSFALINIASRTIYQWYYLKGYKWVQVQVLDTISNPNIIYLMISEGQVSHISLVANIQKQYFLDISYLFDIHQILQVCGLSVNKAIRIDRIEQGLILLRHNRTLTSCSYHVETQKSHLDLLTIKLKFKLLNPDLIRVLTRYYVFSKELKNFLKFLYQSYDYWLDLHGNRLVSKYVEDLQNIINDYYKPVYKLSNTITNSMYILTNTVYHRSYIRSLISINIYTLNNIYSTIQNSINHMLMSRDLTRYYCPSLLNFNLQPLWHIFTINYYHSLSQITQYPYSYVQIFLQYQASVDEVVIDNVLPLYQYWFVFRQLYSLHLFILSKEFHFQTIAQIITYWYTTLNWNLQQVFQEVSLSLDLSSFTSFSLQSIRNKVVISWNCLYNFSPINTLVRTREVFEFYYVYILPFYLTEIWSSFLLETNLSYRYALKLSRMTQLNLYYFIEYYQSITHGYHNLYQGISTHNNLLDVQLNRQFQTDMILWPLNFFRIHGCYYILGNISRILFFSFDFIIIRNLSSNLLMWQDTQLVTIFYGTGIQMKIPIDQIPAISIEYRCQMNAQGYWSLRFVK